MELEGQEPEQPEVPQAESPIDPQQALEIAAQQFGVTPDVLESSLRLQGENQRVYEENRRRARELELKEAQLEALAKERQRYAPPEPQYDIDPALRPVFDKVNSLERMMLDQQRQQIEMEQRSQEVTRLGHELRSNFEGLMRGVPTQNQVDGDQFFAAMQELWPNAEFKELGITPAQAVERTARYLGIKSNGSMPPQANYGQPNPYRNPRASIVIPGAPAMPPTTPQGMDTSPKRPEESIEQYAQRVEANGRRLQQMIQEAGIHSLPERYRSG
jgi:hypothetical protein